MRLQAHLPPWPAKADLDCEPRVGRRVRPVHRLDSKTSELQAFEPVEVETRLRHDQF